MLAPEEETETEEQLSGARDEVCQWERTEMVWRGAPQVEDTARSIWGMEIQHLPWDSYTKL